MNDEQERVYKMVAAYFKVLVTDEDHSARRPYNVHTWEEAMGNRYIL
jgi:hypothetical protein